MHRKTKRIGAGESSPEGDDLRWSVERRLIFIEQRLFWVGMINRTDLIRRYGVSMSQASADINRYLALNPEGVIYDKSAKCYVARDVFRPTLSPPEAMRLLGELRLVDAGLLAADETSFGVLPPFDATPVPERAVDPFILRAVWRAIHEGEALDLRYQSMRRPEPARRLIEPHALAYDGFRWHARAFDRETGQFRDFVLGRMKRPKSTGARQRAPEEDLAWHTWIELQIAPHPDLSLAQAEAVQLDYGIVGEMISIKVRQALLFYALKRLGLDIPPDARSPTAQHIVLVNRDAVLRSLDIPGDA